jgi:hypothetical protein
VNPTNRRPVVRIRLAPFAYALATLSFGWLMMTVFQGWRYDVYAQLIGIFITTVLWTLAVEFLLHWIRVVATRRHRRAPIVSPAPGEA